MPVILSPDEGVQFLAAVSSLKCRAALACCYAAGLRASEVGGLMVGDIDSAPGVILVRHGKGRRTATRCCRRSCSAFGAYIGGWPGHGSISFPAATRIIRSDRPARCLPVGGTGGRADKARDAAHAGSPLCDPALGERNSPDCSGAGFSNACNPLSRQGGRPARLVRLHRRILQSSAAPFRSRVYHPRTGRAPSRLIRCPLIRGKVTSPCLS